MPEKEFVPLFTRLFNWLCKREPYMTKFQWHFMVVMNLLFYLSFVVLAVIIGNQCNFQGYEKLIENCDVCLNNCIFKNMTVG